MKKSMKFLTMFLSICMLVTLMAAEVSAADPYVYTVKLYAGNKGTINGGSDCTVTYANGIVDLNSVDVTVTDEQYYVKGFRLSGQDTIFSAEDAIFPVTKDQDYVVAYGIAANRVAYTVNYQDADGNALAESNTYYGDIGDMPVVAYRYIENYIPQATALTKTLVANVAENVFTFVYTPGATDTTTTTTNTTTNVVPGTATAAAADAGTATAAAGTAGAAAAATPDAAATAAANAAAADAVANPDGATPQGNIVANTDEATPEALQNLDEETPTANIDASENGLSPIVVGGIVGGAAIIALIALLIGMKKMKKKQ